MTETANVTNEITESREYRPRPLFGLPKSLLRQEGKTLAIFALLQPRGLNRHLKRKLAVPADDPLDQLGGLALGELPGNLSDDEEQLLRRWANPNARATRYWVVMKPPKRGPRRLDAFDYAAAIELVLLDAFDAEWKSLTLDVATLMAVCPMWREIRAGIERHYDELATSFDFGVFMLWPRMIEELAHWHALDPERRDILERAVFALSSIALNDWFVREAIKHCPDLSKEFFLLADNRAHPVSPDGAALDFLVSDDTDWNGLLARLDALVHELRHAPTQQTVAALQVLVEEFGRAATSLPTGTPSDSERLSERVSALLEQCRRLAGEPEIQWFDADLLEQIEARWQLALEQIEDDAFDLVNDADIAKDRVEHAALNLRQVASKKQDAEKDLEDTGTALASAKSVVDRRALEQLRREKQKELLSLDELLTSRQDELLAAGSPFGKQFDYGTDYRALAQRTTKLQSEPRHAPEHTADESIDDTLEDTASGSPWGEESLITLTSEQIPMPEQKIPVTEEPLLKPWLEMEVEAESTTNETRNGSIAPAISGIEPPVEYDDYNHQTGEACRPIWKLLAEGRFSMAYQLVKAMSAEVDAPRMPPQLLLDTITLADALILPDGHLHDGVMARLQDFSEDWFQEQGPRAWQDAMSLLLVAATLRPMVLAPDSGASVIAGYLHLDTQGRYPQLWSLVGSLRDSSERLRGFRIDLASLRSARDEAATARELQSLEHEARDWLKNQAPAITIKYAPATKVWHRWLRPDGIIHRMLIPVIDNRVAAATEVHELLRTLSDDASFMKLVRKTDRVDNERRKGDDIHAGALDHLNRCSEEAINLARRWLPFVQTPSHSNDRMRELVLNVRNDIDHRLPAVQLELNQADPGPWQLVASAQTVVSRVLAGLHGLFDPHLPLPTSEPTINEVLAADLIEVAPIRVGPNWTVESAPAEVSMGIRQWVNSPMPWQEVFGARLETGDLTGAALQLSRHEEEADELGLNDRLRRDADSWRSKFRVRLQEARREIEIGSAYGYVSDAVRSQLEGKLVRIEVETEVAPRFDIALESISLIRAVIRSNHDEKEEQIRKAIEELRHGERNPEDIQAVQDALDENDMATANELLQRVSRGLPAWPEEAKAKDSFQSFIACLPELEKWLSQRRPVEEIRKSIKNGDIAALDFHKVAGAQLDQAANMYGDWSFLKSRKAGEAGKLGSFLNALGFASGKPPVRQEGVQGKEIWAFQADPISDRDICPVPHYGAAAKGLYRLICLWERPTEDDIVQMVGDANLHRATLVLYFGRMTERKWRDLSLKTKRTRKSFVLLDEVMLFFLAAQPGSRLAALFSASLPFAFSDPFDATAGFVPPEMFYGRASELDAILGLNGRCFIYGGRQLGKTALMRRAEQAFHAPNKNRWGYYIDLRAAGIGVNRTASEVWQVIAAGIKALGVLAEAPSAAELAKKGGVDALIENIRSYLDKNEERRMLLLLDEADRFFEQDGRHDYAETRRLKLLMDSTQRRFKVVFAGLHNVLRMTERANHPLAHFGQPIKIGPFIEEHEIREARELILRPLAAAGFEFESRSLVMRILAQTNYYPSLIQLYCNHLLQHMFNKLSAPQRLMGPRYKIAGQDIETVYSSSDLRGEIRAKFNYTLQLDPRYEVIAYGMAYEALEGRHGLVEGMDWRMIWQDCAMKWWSEGFGNTSELDFRVLLDEMVELGVLSRPSTGRYGLRNPNVLLLLGNRDEIETVLVRSRQPSVEFDSAVFHPQLRMQGSDHLRHPLTYQQLSEILKAGNTITAIAGTIAAGIEEVAESLQGYVEQSGLGSFYILDAVGDHNAFSTFFKDLLERRGKEGHTVVVVPASVPWTSLWIREAKRMLDRLHSPNRFVSLCFIADPKTLWGALSDESLSELDVPWVSLLPWRGTFVRQYLEDLQLAVSMDDVQKASGYWPSLLYSLVGKCTQVLEIERRVTLALDNLKDPEAAKQLFTEFGLDVKTCLSVLTVLAELGQATESADLAEFAEVELVPVRHVLAWGELLGIVKREGADFWRLDNIVERILISAQSE